jgi:enamine deaminase RidA (YjgF/YER057c/UK114 family)
MVTALRFFFHDDRSPDGAKARWRAVAQSGDGLAGCLGVPGLHSAGLCRLRSIRAMLHGLARLHGPYRGRGRIRFHRSGERPPPNSMFQPGDIMARRRTSCEERTPCRSIAFIIPPRSPSRAEAATPGKIIYVSGQLGLDLDNKIVGAPGDFRAQAEQVFRNLENALAAAGAGFEHVVKLNNYLVDIAHIGIFREVRDRFVDTAAPPASTAIAVPGLARPGALLEVEAIALVPQAAGKGARSPARSKSASRRSAKPAKSPAKLRRKAAAGSSRGGSRKPK